MGQNLEVYILDKKYDETEVLEFPFTFDYLEVEKRIIFDKEDYINYQSGFINAYILTVPMKYQKKLFNVDDYENRYLYLKAKDFKEIGFKSAYMANKEIIKELESLNDDRILVFGWT